jgi:hypothetical protein
LTGGKLAVGATSGDGEGTTALPASSRIPCTSYPRHGSSGGSSPAVMAEWRCGMPAWRLVRAMARAKKERMSSSRWRWSWCAREGEECEGGKGLPAGAATASSSVGRKMADSASYLADSSLKWLSEVG